MRNAPQANWRQIGILLLVVCSGEPAHGVTLQFAGRTWAVKQSATPVGPGPNRFSSRPEDVWSDESGLHLTVQKTGPDWYSTEVILTESLGYGTYTLQTESRQDILDANAVFGAFTWDPFGGGTIPGNPNREIDFEDSRWGNPADSANSQVVVQPYYVPGNRQRLTLPDLSADRRLTRFFTWSPGKVEFTTLRGHHSPTDYPAEDVIHQYVYANDGSDHVVPVPGRENFRFNLWLYDSLAPAGDAPVEVLVTDFQYAPLPESPHAVLFDFESGSQGWGSYGAITTDSGLLPSGSVGQGRFHTADFSLPDEGNFGIVDVSPASQDLSEFVGLSIDALLADVPGQPAFAGNRELEIVVATGQGAAEEEFFAPSVILSDNYQTYSVAFAEFHSAATSLPPTVEQLRDVTVKMVVLNSNGTGTAVLKYDQITGLTSLENADFNHDARIDGVDFLIWQRNSGAPGAQATGDANYDGKVDQTDLSIWQESFGQRRGAAAVHFIALSEPASIVPLATAMVVLGSFLLPRRRAVLRGRRCEQFRRS
ncbi:MAG: hypothetical protein CMJ58_02410 [Planctomycetaceae bacterium]|nr:hypothetical protein [Planctomycetaceae bacterium]